MKHTSSGWIRYSFSLTLSAAVALSAAGGALPPATYFAMVEPYPGDSGNFNLALNCQASTAAAGALSVSVASLA